MLQRKGRKSFFMLVSLICLTLLISACGSKADSENTGSQSNTENAANDAEKTMTDGLGNTVTVPADPKRIIGAYLEDHLITLGVTPVAQWSISNGASVQDYLQDSLKDIPTIAFDLPFEAVSSFEPDLLVIGSSGTVEGDKYSQYSKIAPTFVLGDEINGDWRQALKKVAEVLNRSDTAEQALNDYDTKAQEAKEKLQKASGEQSAAAIWVTAKAFFVVSEQLSSGAVLYQDLGFKVPDVVKEISATGTGNWNSISMEKLAELDADHIFLIRSNAGEENLLNDPIWKSIPAVKNGHVYEFDQTHSWLYSGAIANSKMIDDVLNSLVK